MGQEISGSLEDQVRELRSRLSLLEEALQAYGIVLQTKQEPEPAPAAQDRVLAAPPPVVEKVVEETGVSTPSPALSPAFSIPAQIPVERSLESQIGSQWFILRYTSGSEVGASSGTAMRWSALSIHAPTH